MGIFQPTYKDKKTGEVRTSAVWWYEFVYASKRVRESAKTKRKSIAIEAEKRKKRELERAYAGLPVEAPVMRINTVLDCTKAYRKAYEHGHRAKSRRWVNDRLPHVERVLGSVLLPDLTEQRIREYMKARTKEGAGPRTINMEVAMLARAIGKTWNVLWPNVRHNEEPKDTGCALTPEEETRLLDAVSESRSPLIGAFVKTLLLTALRCGELAHMRWSQVDFENRILTVGKAKTDAGTGRQIPMNQELLEVMTSHARWFTEWFGESSPDYFLFPAGKVWPSDPTRPVKSLWDSWKTARKRAKVKCRLHDLRHTAITKLAESGASDSTIMSLAGHLSRAMMERYSHIRMNAKRQAVEFLSLKSSPQSIPQSHKQSHVDTTPKLLI
jgi:integrase